MESKKVDKKSGLPAVHYYDKGLDFHLADGRIIRAREKEGSNMYHQKSTGIYIDMVMPEEAGMKDITAHVKDEATGRDALSVAFTKESALAIYLMLAHMMDEGFFDDAEVAVPLTYDNRTEKKD